LFGIFLNTLKIIFTEGVRAKSFVYGTIYCIALIMGKRLAARVMNDPQCIVELEESLVLILKCA